MAATSFMKLRSGMLVACMAVVPLVAMFSHKIPRDWRLAAQRFARGEGFAGVERVARGGELARPEEQAPAETPVEPLVATPPPAPHASPQTTAVVCGEA